MADDTVRAQRIRGFGTTIFARMSALAAETGAINLGQGFPDTDGPSEVAEAAIAAIRDGANQYPPLPGTPELRTAIAEHQQRFWSLEVDPDREVLVTAGATEAIAAALLGLCDPGDEVVVFDPTYDSYAAGIAMAGAIARPVLLSPDEHGRFRFDADEFAAAFSDRTKLVLLNTPHNPTGKVFEDEELAIVADACRRHDVIAVTDEVYEHLAFDRPHRPLASLPAMAERTITVSSGGKTFSFTGWKVGWAVGPEALVAAVRTAKQFLTFVNAAPLQPAIATGLRLGDDYYRDFRADLLAKRDLLCDRLDAAGFRVLRPEGTYFATVDVTAVGADDGIEFCLALPEQAGVVAVPSAVFHQTPGAGRSHVRFCFAKRDALLEEAGDRLVAAFG